MKDKRGKDLKVGDLVCCSWVGGAGVQLGIVTALAQVRANVCFKQEYLNRLESGEDMNKILSDIDLEPEKRWGRVSSWKDASSLIKVSFPHD